ncbi:MAG: hypothetical protein U0892_20655 [Pirellulales bacterium]
MRAEHGLTKPEGAGSDTVQKKNWPSVASIAKIIPALVISTHFTSQTKSLTADPPLLFTVFDFGVNLMEARPSLSGMARQ